MNDEAVYRTAPATPGLLNITQARAFFGLVEQVSYAFSKCADMVHFRHLLSPKTQFVWTDELEREFVLAKASIVRKIEKGVTMFEVDSDGSSL